VSVEEEIERWTAAARVPEDILMFHVTEDGETAGQIFLHDIDARPREVMVGYHLVSDEFRGRGLGSEAHALLVGFVRDRMALSSLVLTTAGDYGASQRVRRRRGSSESARPGRTRQRACSSYG
jgi:RimJ/RimL family protein N-acetyltransferase